MNQHNEYISWTLSKEDRRKRIKNSLPIVCPLLIFLAGILYLNLRILVAPTTSGLISLIFLFAFLLILGLSWVLGKATKYFKVGEDGLWVGDREKTYAFYPWKQFKSFRTLSDATTRGLIKYSFVLLPTRIFQKVVSKIEKRSSTTFLLYKRTWALSREISVEVPSELSEKVFLLLQKHLSYDPRVKTFLIHPKLIIIVVFALIIIVVFALILYGGNGK